MKNELYASLPRWAQVSVTICKWILLILLAPLVLAFLFLMAVVKHSN